MIAGAYKTDLLTDFRGAVDKAITQGTTLEDFRKDFDSIVAKNGWSYNGGRNWRSEVIYSTNIRTAYAAGRWEQLTDPEQMQALPYLTYKHGDSRVPRPHHLAWDGITLPANDPWWKTHYPPSGWGCKCRVFGSTRSEHAAAEKKGLTEAPPSEIDPKTGDPAGIDKGWGYNVGEAGKEEGYKVLTNKFETMPYDVARKWIGSYVDEPAYAQFIDGKIAGEFPVAVLNEGFRKEIGARSQTVWLSDETLKKNRQSHPELQIGDYQQLPDIVETAQLVVQDGDNTLVMLRRDKNLYYGALKTTQTGERGYMLSLRLARETDIEAIKKKGKVVRDEI